MEFRNNSLPNSSRFPQHAAVRVERAPADGGLTIAERVPESPRLLWLLRTLRATLACTLAVTLGGCAAAYLVGAVVQSNKKNVDLVLSPGVSAAMLAGKKNIGISVNGGSAQQSFAFGGGATNTNVYADMLTREFLRLGYSTRTITENVSEATTSGKLRELADKGFDLILISNLNFSTTTSIGEAMVGGEGMKTGVTSFTLKGFDPRSGNTLFIASAEYGTAKAAGTVAVDVSTLYRDVLNGTVKPSGGASPTVGPAPSLRASSDSRPASGSATTSAVTPLVQVSVRQPIASSNRAAPTSAPRATPVLVAPGMRAAPGPIISGATVSLNWNLVENATGYAIAVKDLTTAAVVFSAEVEGNESTVQLPSGKLVSGHSYRWSSRARNAEGYGAYAMHLYFRK